MSERGCAYINAYHQTERHPLKVHWSLLGIFSIDFSSEITKTMAIGFNKTEKDPTLKTGNLLGITTE